MMMTMKVGNQILQAKVRISFIICSALFLTYPSRYSSADTEETRRRKRDE
jgi:hypothetical protein